jgi:hypothetical protein
MISNTKKNNIDLYHYLICYYRNIFFFNILKATYPKSWKIIKTGVNINNVVNLLQEIKLDPKDGGLNVWYSGKTITYKLFIKYTW